MPASHQYSLKKKVADHHKKAKKEARKLGIRKPKKSLKKDPGIPNLFPLKEKMLQQAQAAKDKAMEERKARAKADPSAIVKQPKLGSLEDLVANAAARSDFYESTQPAAFQSGNIKEAVLSDKDNSRKAYYKEFKKVVEAADVILEILDARDPLGCRTRQIEELILNSGLNKRIILLLNKIDLVPRENAEAWLKYLRNEFPTIAFKASTQSQRSHLSQSNVSVNIAPENLLNSSECLGADNLMKLLKNYCRNNKIKTSITVGVVGYPNVGKSSVINSLKRAKVCQVGSAPGVTKVSQLIHLDKNVKLLDCPGIVFGKSASEDDDANVILRNCVKVELIDDPIAPVEKIIERCDPAQLIKIYNAPFFTKTTDFLLHIAMSRGKLRRVSFIFFVTRQSTVL